MPSDPRYPYYPDPQGQPGGYYPPTDSYGTGYSFAQQGYGQPGPQEGYYQGQPADYYQQGYPGQAAYQQPPIEEVAYAAPSEPQPYQAEGEVFIPDPIEPAPPEKRKRKRRGGAVWRFVFFVAFFVLVSAIASLGYIAWTYWNGQHEYDELTEYLHVSDEGDAPLTLASFEVDWDALRAINSDIVGWIYVPDTNVNYPIVWKDHDDQYYLKHNFGDNSTGQFGAEYGCIMLSGYNQPDWTDQVNIVFGHHLRNGSMFSQLADFYENSEAFNAHRTYYVLTPQGNFKLDSFACDKVPGSSKDIVIPNFNTDIGLINYIEARYEASSVTPDPPGEDPADIKQVFAFSTCSAPDNNNRIINFCSVVEFLPAGSSVPRDSAIVDAEDIEGVEGMMGERLS